MIFICYITEHLSSPLDFIIRENLHMLHYGAPEFTPGITEHLSSPLDVSAVRAARCLDFCVMFCRLVFVLILLSIVLSVLRFTALH